jgi:hypothetical protein
METIIVVEVYAIIVLALAAAAWKLFSKLFRA